MKKIICLLLAIIPLLVAAQASLSKLIPYRSGGKFGYCGSSMQLKISALFDMAEPFAEDCGLYNVPDTAIQQYGSSKYATVRIKKRRFRINQQGIIVYALPSQKSPCIMNAGDGPFHDNIIFQQNGKFGVRGLRRYNPGYRPAPDSIDVMPGDTIRFVPPVDSVVVTVLNDTVVFIKPQYEEIKRKFPGNRAPFIVKLNGHYGLIDINNKTLAPFNYDAMDFIFRVHNLLLVRIGKESFYMDYTGREFRDK